VRFASLKSKRTLFYLCLVIKKQFKHILKYKIQKETNLKFHIIQYSHCKPPHWMIKYSYFITQIMISEKISSLWSDECRRIFIIISILLPRRCIKIVKQITRLIWLVKQVLFKPYKTQENVEWVKMHSTILGLEETSMDIKHVEVTHILYSY